VHLVFEQGELAGRILPLEGAVLTMGRGSENDVVLAEHGVSRRHVRIQRVPQGWVLTDLGSTNGTFVNGQRIGDGHLLQAGDRVTIGSTVVEVQLAEEAGAWLAEEGEQETTTSGRPRSLLMVLGAVCAVLVLVGLVLLLVTLLRPEDAPPAETPANQIEQFITDMPIPTELQDVMTSVVPLLPSGLPFLRGEETPTPNPGAARPGRERAVQSYEPLPPVPVPLPPG
jgi:pSer/pThr/pTyr-binding forkhead associated (FHA) protein